MLPWKQAGETVKSANSKNHTMTKIRQKGVGNKDDGRKEIKHKVSQIKIKTITDKQTGNNNNARSISIQISKEEITELKE